MTPDQMKKAAAEEALKLVLPGMILGLGTGSTADHFTRGLAAKIKKGLDVRCIPTSRATKELAESLGVPLTTLQAHPQPDLTVDGTDEFDADFNLVKGGGGALLYEKIVATSSHRMAVIADESKKVKTLGKFPLPVEVVKFGAKSTAFKLDRAFKYLKMDAKLMLRVRDKKPFVTDGGHFIIDCAVGAIAEPEKLTRVLKAISGVVDNGLFVGICGMIFMGTPKGVKVFKRK